MIWQQPWGWAGLVMLAIPIVIHLLGRGPARTLRFPTLRFIEQSRLLPVRRSRLHDLLLLAVRVSILAVAVAALAQPLWPSEARQRAYRTSLARVVLADTSESVVRAVGSRAALRDSIDRAIAQYSEGEGGGVRLRIETATPAGALAGAIAWLRDERERREIVILSDFQSGALSESDLATVPRDIGLALRPLGRAVTRDSAVLVRTLGETEVRATAQVSDDRDRRSEITWDVRSRATMVPTPAVALFAGDSSRTRLSSAMRTASGLVPSDAQSLNPTQPVAFLTADAPEQSVRRDALRAPTAPWILSRIAALRANASVQQVARRSGGPSSDSFPGFVVARFDDDVPALIAAEDSVAGVPRLVLQLHAAIPSLLVAAVTQVILQEGEGRPAMSEHEPARMSESTLARWSRTPADAPVDRTKFADENVRRGESDGRWLWAAVLVLLVAEVLLRARMRRNPASVQA